MNHNQKLPYIYRPYTKLIVFSSIISKLFMLFGFVVLGVLIVDSIKGLFFAIPYCVLPFFLDYYIQGQKQNVVVFENEGITLLGRNRKRDKYFLWSEFRLATITYSYVFKEQVLVLTKDKIDIKTLKKILKSQLLSTKMFSNTSIAFPISELKKSFPLEEFLKSKIEDIQFL